MEESETERSVAREVVVVTYRNTAVAYLSAFVGKYREDNSVERIHMVEQEFKMTPRSGLWQLCASAIQTLR